MSLLTGNLVVAWKGLTYDRYNVIAQTKGGDPNNVLVLTAHTDSVDAVCIFSSFCLNLTTFIEFSANISSY